MPVSVKARLRIDVSLRSDGYCHCDLSTGSEGASGTDLQVMIGQALSVAVDTLLGSLGVAEMHHSEIQVAQAAESGGSDV